MSTKNSLMRHGQYDHRGHGLPCLPVCVFQFLLKEKVHNMLSRWQFLYGFFVEFSLFCY